MLYEQSSMANVPDEAIDAMTEVSGAAFRLYVYLCRRRNSRTGECFPSLKTMARETGLDYSYCSTRRSELVRMGWLTLDDNGRMDLLKGFNAKSTQPDLEFQKTVLEKPNEVLENPNCINRNEPLKLTNEIKTKREPRQKRGSRLPEDFTVDGDMREWARGNCPDLDIARETQKFKNYWASCSGSKAVKLDWKATWRNWMLNAMEYKNGKTTTVRTRPTNIEKLAEYEELFKKYE